MPDVKRTPITPEGKRAAERVRLIFFSIAAANLVFFAIVMWQRHHADGKRDAEPPKSGVTENGMPPAGDGAPNATKPGGEPAPPL